MPRTIAIDDPADPRLADYADVKERQFAAEFGGPGDPGSPEARFGKFYAEGKVVLHHLVRSKYPTLSVLATPQQVEANREDLALLPPEVPIYTLPHDRMERVIGFTIHRGLLAVGARTPPLTLDQLLHQIAARPGPLIVLEDLTNHDNIGAIFRNGAAMGATGVILSPRCADPLYRKSLRVSVGLALRMPWARAERWPEAMERLHATGVQSVALTPAGDRTLADFANERCSLTEPRLAMFVGAEGAGLLPATIATATHRLRIPMAGGVDSLNAATACAVALYELARQAPPAAPLE